MTPLPNTSVIPPGWAQHHRPVSDSTMHSPCVVKRIVEGPPPYPLPDGWTGDTPIWSGRCRLQQHNRSGAPVPTDQPTEVRDYLIALPFQNDAGEPLPDLRVGERGDIVEVGGIDYNLRQGLEGTYEFERDFIAEMNQTQQNP